MLKIFFLIFMASGIPVAIAMAGASLVYILVSGNLPPFVVVHRMVSGIDSFPLLAVPFFILAGNLMNNAGITTRIYNFALALVGWLKGGLGHVNVLGSVIFAGMSGTAIADAAGLGTIEIKAMKEHGYSSEFAVGVTAASATLGPIIPPSLPFVIYGMMANVSVGALFLAGIRPTTRASSIGPQRARRLHGAIREVLAQAVQLGGSTLRDFSSADGSAGHFQLQAHVYGREGQPCRLCATPVRMLRQGQRSSYFCPRCQRP